MKKHLLAIMTGACFVTAAGAIAAPVSSGEQTAVSRSEIARLNKQAKRLQQQIAAMQSQLKSVSHRQKHVVKQQAKEKKIHESLQSQLYTLGPTVTTSPYLRLRSKTAYDASDLLVNYPTMNEDLRLLQAQQDLEKKLGKKLPSYYHPRIVLSGTVQGQVIYTDPYAGVNKGDVELSDVELDTYAEAGPWASAFMSMEYDPSATTGGSKVANSRVFLNRGFLMIGNLNHSPVYMTIGQMYVPFGIYKNYLVDAPITEAMFRTNQRAVKLGVDYHGFYGSIYGLRGEARVGRVQGGVNGGYVFNKKQLAGKAVSGNIGAGYIANIADATGMQTTGGTFGGFSTSTATEQLDHAVPAVDGHASVAIGPVSLMGEYITATRRFNSSDLAFNGTGAKPSAADAGIAYNFSLFNKPVTIAGNYNHSWDALALNQPEQSYIGILNVSLFKDTIESLEFRHDINYKATDTASGQGVSVSPTGHRSQNTVYGQIAVYF